MAITERKSSEHEDQIKASKSRSLAQDAWQSGAAVPHLTDDGPDLSPTSVLALQRRMGNRAVSTYLSQQALQRRGPSADSMVQRRGFFSRVGHSIKEGVASAGNAIVDGARATGNAIADGARATGSAIASGAKAVGNKVASAFKAGIYTDDFADLNATQYRVRADRVVEAVTRTVDDEGKVIYFATGIVKSFEGSRPVIERYAEPVSLGDWYPRVTHINGMMVKPEGGIGSAQKLQQVLAEELQGSDSVALEPDVLYTYSATRGAGRDLIECIAGKVSIDDDATAQQETIMMDAVRNQHRTTVSAHSRGTIKTDNAVRNVHRRLTDGFVEEARERPEVEQAAIEAMEYAQNHPDLMLPPDFIADMARKEKARQIAQQMASDEMDKYIQLIYAGNAVQFPSTALKGHLVVASGDMVTILVGKYAGFATPDNLARHGVSGGHGFNENYSSTVGKLIANDLKER